MYSILLDLTVCICWDVPLFGQAACFSGYNCWQGAPLLPHNKSASNQQAGNLRNLNSTPLQLCRYSNNARVHSHGNGATCILIGPRHGRRLWGLTSEKDFMEKGPTKSDWESLRNPPLGHLLSKVFVVCLRCEKRQYLVSILALCGDGRSECIRRIYCKTLSVSGQICAMCR